MRAIEQSFHLSERAFEMGFVVRCALPTPLFDEVLKSRIALSVKFIHGPLRGRKVALLHQATGSTINASISFGSNFVRPPAYVRPALMATCWER